MLGLADRGAVFDLLDAVMAGKTAAALDILADQYASGADPSQVLEDLLGLVHWLTRLRIAPDTADAPGVPEIERVRGRRMAEATSMGDLTRAWQMLLKGLNEVRFAPAPLPAAEMVLVRLAFAAGLPTPAEALRDAGTARPPVPVGAPRSPPALVPVDTPPAGGAAPLARALQRPDETAAEPTALAEPRSFADVVELAARHDEAVLYGHLVGSVHLVAFEPPRITLRPGPGAPADLPRRLTRFLGERTGRTWSVSISQDEGASTLLDAREAAVRVRRTEAAEHPLVRAILERFPGAEVTEVRDLAADVLAPADTDEGDG
jgi:DNA polymerase-3 subunit gamma/tau